MLSEWRKFKGWLVLEFFFKNPNMQIHSRELARRTGIAQATCTHYFKVYEKEGVLKSRRVGNIQQYWLNNEEEIVKQLKKLWFLLLIEESGFVEELTKKNKNIIEVYLYGSYASGEFAEQSDVDLLIIAQGKEFDRTAVERFRRIIGKEIQILMLSIGEWRAQVRKKTPFSQSVLRNHVKLFGGGLSE
ncbi:MAG: nucleotidyltransferase domain-containing protein [Candidatus Anstonellales archaeon]